MSDLMNNKRIFKLFITCYIIAVFNGFFWDWINRLFIHANIINTIASKSITEQVMVGLVLAPIIETFLLQRLPNNILIKLKVRNTKILIIIPSLIFGLCHISYSWYYGVAAFFGGLILNYFYIHSKEISKYFFILTILLHLLYNLMAFIVTNFF